MNHFDPAIASSQIVFLGSFNPPIFQPEWFARHNLISQEQASAAEVKIIVPQVCHFETEQFIILVTVDRFTAVSKVNAHPLPLRDVVQGAFSILEHVPVKAMGLNCTTHFDMGSEEACNLVGDKLAPKAPWDEALEVPTGLLSISITTARGISVSGWRKETYQGARYTIKIEPSRQVKFGVYFETNEHYAAPETEPLKSLLKILAERWEDVPIESSRIADHILSWATTDKQ